MSDLIGAGVTTSKIIDKVTTPSNNLKEKANGNLKKTPQITQKEESLAAAKEQVKNQATKLNSSLGNFKAGVPSAQEKSSRVNESNENFSKANRTKRETSKMMRSSVSEERQGEILSQSLVNKAQMSATLQNLQNPVAQLLKKRIFTKTECSSTSIKLQWEHTNKDTAQNALAASQVQYILEYGIGVKVQGLEQFRQVY